MPQIVFFDAEIEPKTGKIQDLGAFKEPDHTFHSKSLSQFRSFVATSKFFCGHNIFHHDLKFLKDDLVQASPNSKFIDTLHLAPLLFPKKPYHKLLKDEKLQIDDINNPLNDAQKARLLFYDEVEVYNNLDVELKSIYYSLLYDQEYFSAFFNYIGNQHVDEH